MNKSWIIVRRHGRQELPLWDTVSDKRASAIQDALDKYGAFTGFDDWSELKREGYRVTRLTWAVAS
jgi:hypothetical protein